MKLLRLGSFTDDVSQGNLPRHFLFGKYENNITYLIGLLRELNEAIYIKCLKHS